MTTLRAHENDPLGERALFLFFSGPGVADPFGDFRSNGVGHRRSQGAHRRETHVVDRSFGRARHSGAALRLDCTRRACSRETGMQVPNATLNGT